METFTHTFGQGGMNNQKSTSSDISKSLVKGFKTGGKIMQDFVEKKEIESQMDECVVQ